MNNTRIGQYTVGKILGRTNNTISYEVTNKHQNNTLTAEIHQLTNAVTLRTLTETLRNGRDFGVIVEIFPITKNQREYLVVIRDPKAKWRQQMVNMEKMKVSASTCRRLMVEAVELIEGLHIFGLSLVCPIDEFIQTEDNQKNTIRIPKLGHPINYDVYEGCVNNYKNKVVEEISGNQLQILYNFCSKLPSLIELPNQIEYRHPQIDGLIDNLKQANTEGKIISIEKIKKRLYETAIKQEECSLYSRLEREDGKDVLFVEMEDKQNSKLTSLKITKAVPIVKSTEVIEVRELFFIIGSRLPLKQIKLHPKNMVHVWDLTEKKWKLIYFRREERSGNGEEEDEADEAEDLMEPWTAEVEGRVINSSDEKKMEQTTAKNTNRKVKERLKIQYPFSCVVVIKSVLMLRNGDIIKVKGVGTVIHNKYVLTCAHNLFYKWNKYSPRKEACEANIYIPNNGWQQINKMQWIIPQQFWNNSDKNYDFALIELIQSVEISPSLKLAYDYKEADRVMMANANIGTDNNISNKLQQMVLKPNQQQQGILKHRMVTAKGDSGSPFLVQPQGMRGECYVMGMHSSGEYTEGYKFEQNNTAVIITKAVKEQLGKFQRQLGDTTYSTIQHFSMFFEKIKDRPEEHQQQLDVIKGRVQGNFRELSVMGDQRENNMDSALRKLKEGAQLFINQNIVGTVLLRSIFYKDKKKLKQLVEEQQYKKLWQKFHDYSLYMEGNPLFDGMKLILLIRNFLPSNLLFPQSQTKQQYQLGLMQQLQEWIRRELKWEAYVYTISKKMNIAIELMPPLQFSELQLQSIFVEQKLHQLIGLQWHQQQNYKTVLSNQLIIDTQLQKPIYLDPQQSTKQYFPFSSFLPIRKNSGELFNGVQEWKFIVEFESRQLRNSTFWYMYKINHKAFEHLHFRRNKQQKYSLQATFINVGQQTIAGCIINNHLSVPYWLSVMLQMAEFASHLHQRQQSISTKIENSMFISLRNKRHPYPLFFYVQPFAALQYHCLIINPQKKQDIPNQFFPWCQIFSPRPQAAQQVDVWMMGKTFQRIVDGWKPFHDRDVEVEKALRTVISNMTTAPKHRFTMSKVLPYLNEYILNYDFSFQQ